MDYALKSIHAKEIFIVPQKSLLRFYHGFNDMEFLLQKFVLIDDETGFRNLEKCKELIFKFKNELTFIITENEE